MTYDETRNQDRKTRDSKEMTLLCFCMSAAEPRSDVRTKIFLAITDLSLFIYVEYYNKSS